MCTVYCAKYYNFKDSLQTNGCFTELSSTWSFYIFIIIIYCIVFIVCNCMVFVVNILYLFCIFIVGMVIYGIVITVVYFYS